MLLQLTMDNNFDKIWNKYRYQLLNFVKKRIDDINSAEDIVQDVFLKVQLKFETLNDPSKVKSWLYQITRHSIVDYYRKQKPRILFDDDYFIDSPLEENNANSKLQQNVLRMILQLPIKYRQALLLADYKGLKQTEIAYKLGISLSGAKSRIQRARKMMKEIYTNCCHFEFDSYGNILDYYPH